MRGMLQRFPVRGVTLRHAPLMERGDFVWFDLGARELPPMLGDLVCDGPRVLPSERPERLNRGWRVGVVPEQRRLGIRFGEIVVHDADDPGCPGLRRRWSALGVTPRILSSPTGDYVVGQPIQRRDRS